jgi:hypothetical protein
LAGRAGSVHIGSMGDDLCPFSSHQGWHIQIHMYIRIYGKYVYTPYSGSGIRIYSVYIYLVQFLKLVLILIQTSQLFPGLVLICMLQQVRLPLAGLFHRLHLQPHVHHH